METRVAVLEQRVDSLEKRSDDHEKEDERLHRYMTHMMEDLQAKLASLERTGARFESDLTHRSVTENGTRESLKDIFDRLRVLERMAWIAIGSTTAFGAIVTYFGNTLLKLIK